MDQKIAAFDSAIFKKETSKGLYKIAIGAGIVINDAHSFRANYEQELRNLLESVNIKTTRKVYCASEISAMLNNSIDEEEKIISKLFKKLYPLIQEVHFYYTFPVKLEYISAFGAWSRPV